MTAVIELIAPSPYDLRVVPPNIAATRKRLSSEPGSWQAGGVDLLALSRVSALLQNLSIVLIVRTLMSSADDYSQSEHSPLSRQLA